MKTILGYIIPVIPLLRTFKDQNRRFYVFIEQPLIGLITTPISAVFANWILKIPSQFNPEFVWSMVEVYISYQVATVIRDGVNTDPEISHLKKVILNWFYSAASYAIFTAGGKILAAHNQAELSFAYALVGFSFLWPLFSQTLSTYLWTPIFFAKFPKRKLLKLLFNPKISLKQLKLESANSWDQIWINWCQKRAHNHLQIRRVEYWFIKTGLAVIVAILMTTVYFIARWNLVGISALQPQILTQLFD